MAVQKVSLIGCFLQTLKESITNLSCLSFFVVAVAFYSFYYAWPYVNQLPAHLDTIIVDLDGSHLSQRLAREMAATQELKVTEVTDSRLDAIRKLKAGKTNSVITIPQNFARDILAGHSTAVSLVANGSFIVIARFSMAGATGPIQKAYSAAIAKELIEAGIPMASLAKQSLQPPALVIQNMYNTLGGYLNFVLPIVFLIIFQVVFIAGIGFLIGEWFTRPNPPAILAMMLSRPSYYLTILAAFWVLIFAWIMFMEGFSFSFYGTQSMRNVPATLAAAAVYAWTIGCLGMFIAVMMGKCRLIGQLIVPTAIPCVFITGYLYPIQNIPLPMQVLSWFIPSSHATRSVLQASQTGCSIGDIKWALLQLIILGLIYLALGLWRAQAWVRELPKLEESK